MNPQVVEKTNFSLSDLKLYVYGSRESDQFWLQSGNSHSRKPFCLTDVEKFTFNNADDDDDQKDVKKKQPIPNPLFNQSVYKIACGSIHSVVLTTDGRVFTFGCNDEGALGRKGIQCIPIQVKLEDPIDLIAAGDNHSLFANSVNGAIYFTGNYNYKRGEKMTASIYQPTRVYASEINISNKNKRIKKLSCGANHSCVLIGGKVFCRGQPEASTIGRRISKRHKVENSLTFNGVRLSGVTDIECGGYHTVARIEKNDKISYYSWGTNDHGQLGIGTFDSQPYPVEIKRLRGKNIVQIAAGASFTLFLDDEGAMYGCGNNEDSNLGLGEDFQPPQSCQYGDIPSQQLELSDPKEPEKNEMVEENGEKKDIPNQAHELNNQTQKAEEQMQKKEKQNKLALSKTTYLPSVVKIELPEQADKIAAGENFGFAWNKENLYTWGMGYGYVLLNGEENDETEPFQVKKKIINNHTIFELDAGNQHVLYTSYPATIKEGVKIQPIPSVWQNLSIAKLKRKR